MGKERVRTRDLADRYLLDRVLGRGGMSVVWSAYDREQLRNVAVKILSEEYAKSVDRRRRMRLEATVQMNIKHPHVLPVYEAGEADDTAYIVMPIAEGGSCEHHLEEHGALEPRVAARVMTETLDGLGAVHAAGVVHRDIKPSNLLLSLKGSVLLSDFGILAFDAENTSFAGTDAYVAPEARIKGDAADLRADQYGAAATLYHLVTGIRPKQTLRSTEALLETTVMSPELWSVIRRGLATNPAERYPDIRTMRLALLQTLEFLPPLNPSAPALGSCGVGAR